jgi:DNA-binding transcriptional LysR family regulator
MGDAPPGALPGAPSRVYNRAMNRTGELRQYHYFLALAQELHFGRAAELCFITQPALSQQIARLEESVGVRLFARDGRSVSLTPAGEVLRDGAQRLFRLLEETTRGARAAGGLHDMRLSIGLVEYASVPMLPAALKRLHALYPEVRVARHEMDAAAQVEALQRGRIDLGIAVILDEPAQWLPPDGTVNAAPLLAAGWKLLVRDDHPLASAGRVDLDRLGSERVVMFARSVNPSVYDRVLAACRQAGAAPDIVYETSQVQSGVQLAREGLGAMLATGFALPEPLPGMATLAVPGLAPLAMHAFWRSGESQPLVLDFLDIIVEEARRHAVMRTRSG